jgi:hypothetical protein
MRVHFFRRLVVMSLFLICSMPIIPSGAQPAAQSSKQSSRSSAVTAPDWYDKVPPDSANLVAKGRARSNDQQVSLDKAVAIARASLAKSVEKKWLVLLQAIQKENGTRWVGEVESVTLVGSVPKMQKTVKRGKYWTAFVLVALPLESLHASIEQRLHSDARWYSAVKETKVVREFEAASH